MSVKDLLQPREVATSSTLVTRMTERGVSRDLARQRLLRESARDAGIWRSEATKLARNERLFAATEFVGSPAFLTTTADLLKSARPGLARCLHAAQARKILLLSDVARLSATHVGDEPAPGRSTLKQDVESLSELGLIARMPGTRLAHLATASAGNANHSHNLALSATARQTTESFLTRVLIDHFRQQSLLSWDHFEVASDTIGYVAFNGFAFSGTGNSCCALLSDTKRECERQHPFFSTCTHETAISKMSKASRAGSQELAETAESHCCLSLLRFHSQTIRSGPRNGKDFWPSDSGISLATLRSKPLAPWKACYAMHHS